MTTTYRVRLSLTDSEPEIWRLVEMSSALSLPEVHEVLQIAMGWTNSHLHVFISADGRQWWNPASLEEGFEGFDEETATLADVLTTESGPLRYDYDFGDSWEHQIELIEVIKEVPQVPVVIQGERRSPLEDSGGVHGYTTLVEILADPTHHGHQDIATWVRQTVGPWQGEFDAKVLDLERANRLLAMRFGASADTRWGEPVIQLADRMRPGLREEFLTYLNSAPLDGAELDEVQAAKATEPYQWLLRRIGGDGIKLSAAGWMPPAVVLDAVRDLGWESRTMRRTLREDTFFPIREVRESCVRLGLVRKTKGRLLLTATGRHLLDDPLGLWRCLATSWLDRTKPGVDRDGAVLFAVELLVCAHADQSSMRESVGSGLTALGWVTDDQEGTLSPLAVTDLLSGAVAMLDALGGLTTEGPWGEGKLAPVATEFARLALGVRTS